MEFKPAFESSGGDHVITITPEAQPKNEGYFPSTKHEFFPTAGRRKINRALINEANTSELDDEDVLTKMGQFYKAILGIGYITRYILYVIPFGILLAIPIIVGATAPSAKHAKIGDVRIVWFFAWIEVVWCSLWCSKIAAKTIPYLFRTLIGVVSSGTRKYYKVIQALEVPLSFVAWTFFSFITFHPLMTSHGENWDSWKSRLQEVLVASVVSAVIFLAKSVLVQIVSIRYHQHQFARDIKESKESVQLLTKLYDRSRVANPDYTDEFLEEDSLLHAGVIVGDSAAARAALNRVGDNIASVFGTVAKEITGAEAFSTDSTHSLVINALDRGKIFADALARRIWTSFAEEGKDVLFPSDLTDVIGVDSTESAFQLLDKDKNGDVSLEEMCATVNEIGRQRKALNRSMNDIDSTIDSFSTLLTFVVLVMCVFVYIAFLNDSLKSTFSYAGTLLVGSSFAFAGTITEIVSSVIFIFVKHPYNVGDRVDMDGYEYVVDHISLLYTIFHNLANNKLTQIPNNVLNTKNVENVSRSNAMHETVSLNVSSSTSFDILDSLRNNLQAFVKENNRDFHQDLKCDISTVGLDKLELQIRFGYKGNWADQEKRAERRRLMMKALVTVIREVGVEKA